MRGWSDELAKERDGDPSLQAQIFGIDYSDPGLEL
jgi:hypothetical protein